MFLPRDDIRSLTQSAVFLL